MRNGGKTFMRAMGQVAGRLQQDGGEAGSTPARSRNLCRAGAWLCRAALRGAADLVSAWGREIEGGKLL